MTDITVGVKTDEVGPEHSFEKLFPPGQVSEDFKRREGDVMEVADLGIGQALPEHLRKEHQVIVVDPDDVVRSGHFHHGITELLVHPLVDVPRLLVVVCEEAEVVKDRPEGVVAEPIIIVFDVIGGEEDRVALLFSERLDDLLPLFILLLLNVHTRPANPDALVGFVE